MRLVIGYIMLCAVLASGCNDMWDQPKATPLSKSDFFSDSQSARPLIKGTVARGELRTDDQLYTGKAVVTRLPGDTAAVPGEFASAGYATTFPMPVTREVLLRGQERFNIFCSPCHGAGGDGDGMIVQRGFKQPPTYHQDRLRNAPPGYFFDVITNGFGVMYSYASRVPVEDRWAIVAYIRALQLSRDVKASDIPAAELRKLEGTK